MAKAKKERRPFFLPKDKDNIRWFWNRYLKKRTPWLIVVLGLVSLQGVVYQQFLALTEAFQRQLDDLRAFSQSGKGESLRIHPLAALALDSLAFEGTLVAAFSISTIGGTIIARKTINAYRKAIEVDERGVEVPKLAALLFLLPFSRFFHVIMSPVIVAYNTILDAKAEGRHS